MRTLCLLRHAKSSWRDAALSDRERPLNKRGRRDAPRMGAVLAQRHAPMTFAVSPATRAQQTFEGLRVGWQGLLPGHCETEPLLYTFDRDDVLAWTARQTSLQRLAIIGHNPALTECINFLVGDGTLDNLPTAGWVELSLPIDHWSEITDARGAAALTSRLFPREITGPAPTWEA